jgi:hypothetical protein
VQLAGVGGHLGGLEALDDDGVFLATVTPSAVGMLEVRVAAGCGVDAGGNVNLEPSNSVQVRHRTVNCEPLT